MLVYWTSGRPIFCQPVITPWNIDALLLQPLTLQKLQLKLHLLFKQTLMLERLQWYQKLNWHSIVRVFDLIPKLRARPKYQLSDNPHVLLLYLGWLIFLSQPTTLGFAQQWWPTFNHCQSGYSPTLENTEMVPKKECFVHFRKSQWVEFTTNYLNPQLDIIELDFQGIFIGKHCLIAFIGIL